MHLQKWSSKKQLKCNMCLCIADSLGCLGFPGGSAGKEFVCNAGDLGSIPGLGRSPGEENSYPLQYSCLENPTDRGTWQATVHGVTKSRTWLSDWTEMMASVVAQQVKNLPAMQEALVRFLDWEDLLEKRIATHSSILAWRIPQTV